MSVSESEWLTKAEAAETLKVSQITVSRWIKQGRLAASRVGPRAIRIRRSDLDAVVTPLRDAGEAMRDAGPPPSHQPVWVQQLNPELIATLGPPMTAEEKERALEALEIARVHREQAAAERGGVPFPPSWPLMRQSLEERTDHIIEAAFGPSNRSRSQ